MTTATRVIAVVMPNTQSVVALPWGSYRTTVDAIEVSTGLDFLPLVPATVQATVDSGPTE